MDQQLSDKDIDRQRNCLEKQTWKTRELANASAAYAAWRYGEGAAKPHAYRCRYCELWHLARSLE